MPNDKGRKKGRNRERDDDDDLENDEGESSESHTDSLERAFSSSNWRRAVEGVVSEYRRKNDRLLARNRDLKARVAEFEENEPDEDSRVLSKDEAAEYDAFKALKLKPAEITAALTERDTLKSKETERSEEEQFADAAEALGFENVALFTRMLKREGLHLEFRDERVKDEESGKTLTMRMPVVRPKSDDKAQLEPLDAYLEREMPEIIPVLQSEPGGSDDGEEEGEDGELAGVGGGAGGRTIQTIRRSASRSQNGTSATAAPSGTRGTGVRMPVARMARPSTGAARNDKALKEQLEQKRATGGYSL